VPEQELGHRLRRVLGECSRKSSSRPIARSGRASSSGRARGVEQPVKLTSNEPARVLGALDRPGRQKATLRLGSSIQSRSRCPCCRRPARS
jgi:hypothetical protein